LNGIKIRAVGDICPGDKAIMGLGVLHKSRKFSSQFLFEKIKPYFAASDLVIGNLEGLLTASVEQGMWSTKPFCGLPGFAQALVDAGFNIINVSNNHVLEYGPETFKETIDYLKKSGIGVCGLRSKERAYYSEPVIIEKKNKVIGVIGYNWVGVDKFEGADDLIAQSRDSIVNYGWQRNRTSKEYLSSLVHKRNTNVLSDIQTLSEKVDLVILMTHWGYEFVHTPPFGVTLEAKSFIDAGADCIIGSHPHVIQGFEFYQNKPIFYSLGNFIFDSRFKKTRYSVILDLIYSDNHLSFNRLIPVYINSSFQPQKAEEPSEKKICSIIEASNRMIQGDNMEEGMDDNLLYEVYERQYKRLKINNIMWHFLALKYNPIVIVSIVRKVRNFLSVLQRRFRGDHIRW